MGFARRFFQSTIRKGNPFIFTINTANTSTGSTSSTQFKLPLIIGGTYDFIVDWGDGNSDIITVWNDAATTHTYSTSGNYTILISGTITGLRFNNTGDRLKILNIQNFGPLRFTGSSTQFWGCSNMDITATDTFDISGITGTGTQNFFLNCSSLVWNSSVNSANVSGVNRYIDFFRDCSLFNQPLDNWVSSGVDNISGMLRSCTSYAQNLGNWDVSEITAALNFMNGVNLPVANYDNLLIGWSTQTLKSGVTLTMGTSKYSSAASSARAAIVAQGWTINDGGMI
jgi:hypothetical protein